MRILVAYWHNTLGEECSSCVFAEFEARGRPYVVVRNRRKTANGGMDIMPREACDVIRYETPVGLGVAPATE